MTSIKEAVALYQSIPSVVSSDGKAGIKRRALAIEIVRIGDTDDFSIAIPRAEKITLESGKIVAGEGLSPLKAKASEIIGDTVTIGGVDYPVALAFAIINQWYVDREKAETAKVFP